jgi:preprotein translocase subunit SecG
MYVLTVVLYLVVCLFLIAVVLLQTGKRADLAGAFGGGGSQTAFGTRGAATFLSRLTTVFAILFMVLSLALSIWSSGGKRATGSVLDTVPAGSSAPAPMAPAPGAPRQETGLPTDMPPAGSQGTQPEPQPEGK